MSNENTSPWAKIKSNVTTAFSAVGNWFAQTAVGEWVIDKYHDFFGKDDKDDEKNDDKPKESDGTQNDGGGESDKGDKPTTKVKKTVYDVVGAGNSRLATFDTESEAETWRKENSPSSTVVPREVEVEQTTESNKNSKNTENPYAGKWTVYGAGAPIGGVHDTKESAEEWRKNNCPSGTVMSYDELSGKRASQADSIVDSDSKENEASAEMD